jgi:monoamine oxidase
MMNLTSYVNAPILAGFNAGSVANNFENQSDEQVVNSLMTYLRSVFGPDVPEPIGYYVTRWGKDPYSHGSYSHVPPGATGEDYATLGQPVLRLRFAGEATLKSFPASVRGAYLSGVREADRIIDERE